MGTSTDIDDIRGNTGDTLGKTDTGTRDETEDVTSRGPDRVLIRCEVRPRLDLVESLTRVEGSIPPGLRGITLT